MGQYSCFAGLEKAFTELRKARIALLPVPYDMTSTWIKGADKGPAAIISSSPVLEFYDIETDFEVYKAGIHTCSPIKTNSPPEKMIRQVELKVLELLKADKFVVTLGGEHSVSIGPITACNTQFKDLSVLQLDAHADLRNEYEGSRYNHACVMARVKEMCPFVQVGIRSMCVEEKAVLDEKNVFFAKDITGSDEWIDRAAERLSDNVYVTIDLDVFDPSVMPSTGTPQPGGLTWYGVMRFLKTVSARKNIVGFDVVELCPNPNNKAPDFMAAKLVYKFLSYIYSKRVKGQR
ncbi:MAG: agmatinase [Candidatus Omnitrophota bacterium]